MVIFDILDFAHPADGMRIDKTVYPLRASLNVDEDRRHLRDRCRNIAIPPKR